MNTKFYCRLITGIFLAFLIALRLLQPGSERTPSPEDFQPDRKFSFHIAEKASWPLKRMALQNGRPLLETNDIDAVRNIGNGQYFWHQENGLYLAPISNVDPRNAGSGISVQTFVFVRLRYIAAALFLFMMALTMQWWSLPLQRMLSRFLPPCGNKENAGMELYGNPSLPDVEAIFLGNRNAGCWNWSDFDLTACVCTWWASVDRRYKTALVLRKA